ncbi:MAG: hypothetical protein KME27_00520 [Lyngbya sp. HA4199-MV5]|jgi:hypothetical protein|nr:hypothetical protein [Lyngbya sp. HA4199-MV5]
MKDETLELTEKLASIFNISPPDGFRVVTLGKIADLKVGLNSKAQKVVGDDIKLIEPQKFCLLTPKNILSNGKVDLESASKFDIQNFSEISETTPDDGSNEKLLVQANDILISRILTKTNASIAMIPDDLPGLVTFADSVVRVRVNSAQASPISVFEFLRSDSGWILLQGFASSLAGMPRISLSGLAETPIFLPEEQTGRSTEELSAIAVAIRRIKDEILPALQKVESVKGDSDCNDSVLRNSNLKSVADECRRLASSLTPPPLTERVIENYPTPIALAYRRFHDSRFNVYEQVQRLRDLFESTSFFIYNLVLSDFLRRLDPEQFYIKDSGARRAYNTFAMSGRIDFIKEIVRISSPNHGADLFIPELVSSSFTEQAEKLKDLRNHLAHTATATESRQRKILDESKPIVTSLLSELEFLTDYRLVRIPSFYRRRGQLIYRMEVYQGAVPHLDEQSVGNDSQLEELQLAEHDHLVMLNNAGQVLDLYPLCQLVDNEETQYENHMCFLKRCKTQERLLEGESIQNSAILLLEGFDEFEKMKERILAEPLKPPTNSVMTL